MVKRIHPVEKPRAYEHDYITGAMVKIYNFVNANKKAVFAVIILVIIAAAAAVTFEIKKSQAKENSWKELAMAVMFGDENSLDTVPAKYPGTDAALYSRYFKADAFYGAGNFAKSIPVFKELSAAKNKELAALAQLSLAAAYQADGKFDDSVKTASDFLARYPNNFALPQAYLTLALSQELAGRKEAAVENYKIITARFPKTYFGAFAANKLKDLVK
ncbi:MAG: tetratricopeptide repeat protein [Elusimicrobium sp.]|jgi:tetratricopeptide (TPR) repeat protein|nr:tetratricopeptide repeat protein [Elusimicrobium sp.]